MLAKMKASAEQELEKKTADLKPVLITERKPSAVDKKDNASEKSRSSLAVSVKKPQTGPKPVQKGRNHSLTGMLATKKFFKRLSRKKKSTSSVAEPAKQYEPTYRLHPKQVFNQQKMHDVVKELIDNKLEGMIYSKRWSGNLTKIICNQVKEKVKALHFERYKIICNVMLGENNGTSVLATSRCSWDQNTDGFMSYSFQSNHLFCNVTVYAVYQE